MFSAGPFGTVEFGILFPFRPVPLGFTDGAGTESLTVHVGANYPLSDLYVQGAVFDLHFLPPGPPRFSICTSDVEGFRIGS